MTGATGTVGIIGAGNMARSLVGGLLASGVEAKRIVVSDSVAAQRAAMQRDFGVAVAAGNDAAARAGDILVLAVKPGDVRGVAAQIRPAVSERRPLIISVAAGIRVGDLSGWLGGHESIVRTMPNRPALVRKGVTVLFADARVDRRQREIAENLMRAVGATAWVEQEGLLDAVTAVSGSGPAYFFLLMELLEQAARELGLPQETARLLAVETAYGAAGMAHECPESPEALRAQVTSAGGTTAAALRVLEEADLRGIVSRAVAAACRRATELAGPEGGPESGNPTPTGSP